MLDFHVQQLNITILTDMIMNILYRENKPGLLAAVEFFLAIFLAISVYKTVITRDRCQSHLTLAICSHFYNLHHTLARNVKLSVNI